MIVVLPVCHKDADAALRNLQWIRELDGQSPFHCVVSHDTGFDASEVLKSARLAFTEVSEFTYPPPKPRPWPGPENVAWQRAAFHIHISVRQPWLWWEQDAVPIRKGWLMALAEEYRVCRKPFMGALCTMGKPHHLTGIAVYPPNVPQRSPAMMMATRNPFDGSDCAAVLAESFITPKIQVDNSRNQDIWQTDTDLQRIKPETVLYHRCKDGSLLNLLQRQAPSTMERFKSFLGFEKVEVKPVSDVSVVITNFHRPDMLWEAYASCQNAGVSNIVISSSGTTQAVQKVLDKIKIQSNQAQISTRPDDAGCNETWLRGARLVKTKRMTILHDDDRLLPSYQKVVSAAEKADVVHWDGEKHCPQGSVPGRYITRPDLPEGIHPITYLLSLLLSPKAFTLSPVCGCFPTQHVIETLEECEQKFGSWSQLRPGMMIGNDLMLWLRACQKFRTVYYSHEPCVSYGHWNGSVTFDDVSHRRMRLLPIYKATRRYFLESCPSMIHTVQRYMATDPDTISRISNAERSWQYAYSLGLVLPNHQWHFKRDSTSIGEAKQTPFLKDVLVDALKIGNPGDFIVLTNDDTITTQFFWFRAWDWLKEHGAGCSFRHNIVKPEEVDPSKYYQILPGKHHCGRDAWFFTKGWLTENLKDIPDYLLGFPDFDSTLDMLIRLSHGKNPSESEFLSEDPCSNIPPGFIYHVDHEAPWTKSFDQVGNKHNRHLTDEFFKSRLGWPVPKLRGSW